MKYLNIATTTALFHYQVFGMTVGNMIGVLQQQQVLSLQVQIHPQPKITD